MKYTLGLAGCFHMLKEYGNAAQAYVRCSLIDAESPIPYYHAYDCFMHLNDPVSAAVVLQLAIDKAGDKPLYAVIKQRCELSLQQIKGELNEIGK